MDGGGLKGYTNITGRLLMVIQSYTKMRRIYVDPVWFMVLPSSYKRGEQSLCCVSSKATLPSLTEVLMLERGIDSRNTSADPAALFPS